MKHSMFTAAALVAGLAFAGAAVAQPPAGGWGGGHGAREAVHQACAADIQKFCPDAKPGRGGGMLECVMSHHSDFSQPCQDALAKMRAARQQQGGGEPPPRQ